MSGQIPEIFEISRPKRNKDQCRECGCNRIGNEFPSMGNICLKCKSEYNNRYRGENKEKISAKRKVWYDNLDQKERWGGTKRSIERSIESFIRNQVTCIKKYSIKPGKQDTKDPVKREFNLTVDYVMDVYNKQNGKCAIFGVPLIYKFNSLYSISIDRIDSSKGHIIGNIQILSQAANMMKRDHKDEEVIQFLDNYFKLRQEASLRI
jgi:hypothetical protein